HIGDIGERVPGLLRLHVPDHGTRQGLLGADPISLFEDLVDVYWWKLEPRTRWRVPRIIVLAFRRVECNGRRNLHRTLRAPDIVIPSSTDFAGARALSNVSSARVAISASPDGGSGPLAAQKRPPADPASFTLRRRAQSAPRASPGACPLHRTRRRPRVVRCLSGFPPSGSRNPRRILRASPPLFRDSAISRIRKRAADHRARQEKYNLRERGVTEKTWDREAAHDSRTRQAGAGKRLPP